ncbi:MAG: hypothetical protein JNL08_16670 [Planctomycetes bacterium]|nr:hypothetical protein [Planctomycetota bacterium]
MNGIAATPGPARARWWLAAAVPALVLAAWQATFAWPFVSDDAFVSLRYADRLLHGQGLTWTDGERVEGYSNLLWVLACAGLGALGIDLVTAARALGAACTAGALLLLARALAPHDRRTAVLAALPPLWVAASQPVLAWTLAGLEGPLVLLCLAAGFGALLRCRDLDQANGRTLFAAGAPFALACWTRPDSPLWIAVAGAVLGIAWLRTGAANALRRVALLAALPLAAVAAQLAFRLAYYGDLVPNTAHVKAEFDPGRGGAGVDYVLAAASALPAVVWPGLLGALVALARPRTRWLAAALLLPVLAWSGYLMAIGGDHFPGRRLWHGALVPLALLAGLALREFAGAAWRRTLVLAGLGAATAAWGTVAARTDPQSHELRHEVWEWRGQAVGAALARAFAAERPLLAVDAAGAVPFWSRLPALDMLGLCDRTIATTPYRDWLHAVKARGDVPLPPGHLRGNGAYVMDRAPDLISMGPPPGLPLPVFVSALEFEHDPRFLAGYRCVRFAAGSHAIPPGRGAIEAITAPLWFAVHGRLGVAATAERIEIPALLFGSLRYPGPLLHHRLPPPPDSPVAAATAAGLQQVGAWWNGSDAVVVPAAGGGAELELRGARAEFAWPVPAGRWRLAVEPPSEVRALAVDPPAIPPDEVIVLTAPREVRLVLERAVDNSAPIRVRRVVLRRE